MVPAEQLLAGLTLLPVPLAAAPAWLGGHGAARHGLTTHEAAGHGTAGHGAAGHGTAGQDTAGHGAAGHGATGHGAAGHGAAGHGAAGHGFAVHGAAAHHLRVLPKVLAALQPKTVVAAVTATGCVAAGGIAIVRLHHHSPPPPAAVVAPATSAPAPQPTSPQPRPTHHRSPRPRHTVSPPARLAADLKGVCAWSFPGVSQALARSGASWYYNWSASHAGIVDPPGVSFVPMIWGSGSVTSATLARARSEGHVLLGFNEPDLSSQANMTVADALRLWPRLMATGMELGSPAVATDAATPGSWLDRFMRGAAARGYRVNFIAVHWYGSDFATGAAVSQFRGYLQAIHDRYHLPIWVTEFGLVAFGHTPQYPTDGQQAAFVTAATSMLAGLGYVQRYAWFALPVTSDDGNMGLFASGPVVTSVGRAFQAAGR
jgi:hypothetical protein